MKALATLCLTGLLLAGALVPAAAAENGSPQPSAIERLVLQEDARGTVGASPQAPSQPTAVERLVRQEDARRNDPVLGITRATQVSSVPTPPRIEVVARDGFDWLDAAIGAASAIALVAAFGCATLVVRALTPRQGITLIAVASVATVVSAGVGAAGGTPPWSSALHARSDAMNRHYGLGQHARESARANAAPDWMTALNARSDALNRQYGLGEYGKS